MIYQKFYFCNCGKERFMESQIELFKNLNKDNTLTEIQEYTAKVLKIRGFSNESVQEKLLCLSEEVGELIKAVRKCPPNLFVGPTHAADYRNIEEELADVLILLIDVSNKLNMNLFECLKIKEEMNLTRKWVKNPVQKAIPKQTPPSSTLLNIDIFNAML